MRDFRLIAICLVSALVISFAWLAIRAETVESSPPRSKSPEGLPESTSQPVDTDDDSDTPAPTTAQLMQKIRKQVGSPLDDSLFGKSLPAGEALCEEFATPGPLAHDVDFAELYAEVAESSGPALEAHAVDRHFGNIAAPHVMPPPVDFVQPQAHFRRSLRDAARHLEAAAADLEDQAAYIHADELRRWAHRLRKDAREDKTVPSDPIPTFSPITR